MSLTGVTLCSGGGLAALGMEAAGVQLVGAVESDLLINLVYTANLGDHCRWAPVQDVDYRQWAGVDLVQVSPPCPNFSSAKQGGEESPADQAIAAAICRAIETIRPRYVWLENVEGYAKSASYAAIRACLDRLDYWSHAVAVNSADYGVPQTRRRLILRAVAGGWMQPFRPLPAPVPWVGWYAAIADLLDTLPASEFAPWQLARLPAEIGSFVLSNAKTEWGDGIRTADEPMLSVTGQTAGRARAFLVDTSTTGGGGSIGVPHADAPAPTVRAGANHQHRAFLLSGHSDLAIRAAADPMVTLTATDITNTVHRAFLVDGMNSRTEAKGGLNVLPASEPAMSVPASGKGAYRAWLHEGRVVRMTPRALARFQSVPDSYQLPDRNDLACRVIGNGVPPLLALRITESLIGVPDA